MLSSPPMGSRAALVRRLLALLLAAAPVLLAPIGVGADEPTVRYHGQVVWITGNEMMFRDDDGWTFPVNLWRVPQSAYQSLSAGDWVTVVGFVSRSRSHVIADSVRADR
jgi:hypothetical protein